MAPLPLFIASPPPARAADPHPHPKRPNLFVRPIAVLPCFHAPYLLVFSDDFFCVNSSSHPCPVQVFKAHLYGVHPVAVKVFRAHPEVPEADFWREINILRTCRHRSIVQVWPGGRA